MKTAAIKVKTFVAKHKEAIVVAGIAYAVASVLKTGLNQHNEFLKEKGLYEEFYAQVD